jgi:hypothetical protein
MLSLWAITDAEISISINLDDILGKLSMQTLTGLKVLLNFFKCKVGLVLNLVCLPLATTGSNCFGLLPLLYRFCGFCGFVV